MDYDGIKKIRVFLDTNVLESRHEESCLCLNSIKLHSDFYKLLDFCDNLTEVTVCIPSIVWMEICIHLSECYNSTLNDMYKKFNLYKKTFGELIELNLDTKEYTKENYNEYINKISDEFWSSMNNRCDLIAFDAKVMVFAEKAIRSVEPFVSAKAHGKTYSDAGFKDAVIAETIISNCQDDEIAILFTKDRDFDKVFNKYGSNKFITLSTLDDVKNRINAILKRNDDKIVQDTFENDSYIQESLLSHIGVPYDKAVTTLIVEKVEKIDNSYLLQIKACANEVDYNMKVKYDMAANEIIDVNYEQYND